MITEPPTMLLMAGLPGAGKSTLAAVLGRELHWPILDKDTVKTALLLLDAEEALAGPASYQVLFDLAQDLLITQRLSVILDWPSFYPSVIDKSRAITAEAGGALRVVLCSAGPETRERRIRDRASRISQPGHPGRPTPAHGQSDGDGREHFPFLPADTLEVSTDRPPADLAAELLPRIRPTATPGGFPHENSRPDPPED